MTVVLVTGVFDILHEGHKDLFRQARALGDRVVVIAAHDANVANEKGAPMHSQEERTRAIRESGLVDNVQSGNKEDKLRAVEKIQPDIILLGYDQNVDEEKLRSALAKRGLHPRIVRGKAFEPEQYKSSKLRTQKQKV